MIYREKKIDLRTQRLSPRKDQVMFSIDKGKLILSLTLGTCYSLNVSASTFPEFLESLPRLPNGNYVYDHDLATSNIDTLYDYYEYSVIKRLDPAIPSGDTTIQPYSLVKLDRNGNDAIWSGSQKDNLTYCIQRDGQHGFQDNYYRVANAMRSATRDWEASANVNFSHNSSQDANCEQSDEVLFRVLETWASWQGGGVQAAAFFPDSPAHERILWIAADMPQNTPAPISFSGLLRHELGHVIGLVHEHAREDLCPEAGDWRALTAYDRYSVMHYRVSCNGPNTDYFLSNLDRQGVGELYPFPPDPDPTPVNSPPVARLALSGKAYAQQNSILDGTASNDNDGHIVRYHWTFGDGQSSTTVSRVVEHQFNEVRSYRATLQVRDNDNALSALTQLTINVDFNPALFPAIYSTTTE
jgi:hypothetical protein